MHRTSVTFSETLLRRAKLKAASEGTTISEVLRALLSRWTRGEISLESGEPETILKEKALGSFGMWTDRDPDKFLEESRSGLKEHDQELTDARLDAR